MNVRITAMRSSVVVIISVMAMLVAVSGSGAGAQPGNGPRSSSVASSNQYWTPARMAAATPRDLVLDHRGLAYLKAANGSLQPYGHSVAAEAQPLRATAPAGAVIPQAAPARGGSGDSTAPVVSGMDPGVATPPLTIGASYPFRATVTDNTGGTGVKSVNFVVGEVGSGTTQTFAASSLGNDLYGVDLSGFTNGDWGWKVVAKDRAKRGGNTVTTDPIVTFTVETGTTTPTTPPSGGPVVNAEWTSGGPVQTAAGRIYFEMPTNKGGNRWGGFVCSGTVVTETTATQTNAVNSFIMTAAHCVYDDVHGKFARNVMFIPNQAATTASGTDLDCSNDPLGCWLPTGGVVDSNWTTRTFPDNIPWDYAFYVVPTSGQHRVGLHTVDTVDESLEIAARTLAIDFGVKSTGDATSPGDGTDALGYSYDQDPKLMYCSEGLGTEPTYDDYWLGSCGLSGGASGGPWLQPAGDGNGSIIAVNSWGYTNLPGMGAAPLVGDLNVPGGTASCVFVLAQGNSSTGCSVKTG